MLPRAFLETHFLRELLSELKRRQVRALYITEITSDNIHYCKMMVNDFGFELRHLENTKGNFATADRTAQYWGYARVESEQSGQQVPQLVWSNVPAIVEQNQFVFDSLWSKAMPAEVRFRELEHGIPAERTDVLFGQENVEKAIVGVILGAESKMHACIDLVGPSMSLSIEPVRQAISEASKKKIKPQYITEITRENIDDCRRLIGLGVELRHLDGIKGNFGVTDSEYCATSRLESEKPILQLVYSNSKPVVEQHEYLFQTLWNRATPAETRFKEIEEGLPRYDTRILRDPEQILEETKKLLVASKRYSVSSVAGGLSYATTFMADEFRQVFEKIRRGEHEGIRWLTTIDETNAETAKKFIELGMEIRHTHNLPAESFGVSDKGVGITVTKVEVGKLTSSAMFSDDPVYVGHYLIAFEELWKSGSDASVRIKEIKEGIEEPRMRIIRNRTEVPEVFVQMVDQANEELLLLLPSSNSYRRLEKIGVIDSLRKAAKRGVKIRILAPRVSAQESLAGSGGIEFKAIREATGLNTVTVLVVDKTRSLIIEQQDDTKEKFVESIGVATYSSRGSTVKANIRFFERMWEEVGEREREVKLLEKERRSRMEAELLQDILAHDIRNYNQAARLNAELLQEDIGNAPAESLKPLVDSVISSIDGSTRLVERAAKIGKILAEGSSVTLSPVSLAETIASAETVVRRSQHEKEISIEKPHDLDGKSVMADEMLQEVFVNLFSNSGKYTEEKQVRIDIQLSEIGGEEEISHSNGGEKQKAGRFYKISITDYGHGIANEQKSDLFTRYLKTARGSGLGLSIVHALVHDRYGGKITVRDRVEGDYSKGTVIEIILPKS